MTERYFPNDPELINEIIEASEELIAESLTRVFGAASSLQCNVSLQALHLLAPKRYVLRPHCEVHATYASSKPYVSNVSSTLSGRTFVKADTVHV